MFVVGVTMARGSPDPAWRAWRTENFRRSLAMLGPDQVAGLRKEEAIELIEELQRVQARLNRLRAALRRLADEDP